MFQTSIIADVRDVVPLGVDLVVAAACLGKGCEYGLVLHLADHDGCASLEQGLYGLASQDAGQNAVVAGRRAAPLDMSESRDAGLVVRYALFDLGGYVHRAAQVASLGYDDDAGGLVLAPLELEVFAQALDGGGYLGYQSGLCTGRDSRVEGDEAGVTSHYLHEEGQVVAVGRVAQLVYGLYGSVYRRVETDGEVGSVDVVVYGAGDSDYGESVLLV